MKTAIIGTTTRALALTVTALALCAASANAAAIYSDDFSGAGGLLNGTTPDVSTTGAAWQAGDLFYDNGYTATYVAGSANGQAAWLPFTPYNGRIYTASAGVLNTNPNWVAFGFVSLYPDNNPAYYWTNTDYRVRHSNSGYAWMLIRNRADQPDLQGFLGYRTGNQVVSTDSINSGGWNTFTIVLDTMNPAQWTTAFYSNNILAWSGNFSPSAGPGIAGVGFSHERNASANTGAYLAAFGLDEIPEPSTCALLGLGALACACWLRRRK